MTSSGGDPDDQDDQDDHDYGFMMDDGHPWGVMNAVREVGAMNVTDAENDDVARWLTKKHWSPTRDLLTPVATTSSSPTTSAANGRSPLPT